MSIGEGRRRYWVEYTPDAAAAKERLDPERLRDIDQFEDYLEQEGYGWPYEELPDGTLVYYLRSLLVEVYFVVRGFNVYITNIVVLPSDG
jgi:hypothetical protein